MVQATKAPVLCAVCACCLVALGLGRVAPAEPPPADVAAPQPPATDRQRFELPGITIHTRERFIDLDATVCLDRGYLELIACSPNTKEHESIVVVQAQPRFIHMALLMLGARNGNPAMRKRVGDRWVELPPRGDIVAVSLVLTPEDGEPVERPIRDFVMRDNRDDPANEPNEQTAGAAASKQDGEAEFPAKFLFAGSHLVENPTGENPDVPRQYLADQSGNVISIATFGDEVLCLPGRYSADNDALVWQVNPATAPKPGSKVKLRLRLLRPPAKATS